MAKLADVAVRASAAKGRRRVALGLGGFGVALGLIQFAAPKAFGRAIGLEERAGLIRVFGVREIVSGLMIVMADAPETRLWTRAAGDALDGAVLAAGLAKSNPHRLRTLVATAAVAPIVLLDLIHTFAPAD